MEAWKLKVWTSVTDIYSIADMYSTPSALSSIETSTEGLLNGGSDRKVSGYWL